MPIHVLKYAESLTPVGEELHVHRIWAFLLLFLWVFPHAAQQDKYIYALYVRELICDG